ncbi:MAG: long-chain fatty acid--CoA ligase [Hydrocarboniphaga sp.]|uniref:class I adenylate-forming enzyme family protein n=1 Tax=Hydrocarboniphaga sp. TaxID=2033016 RepID=UPI002607AD58|nr:class I adenylate-forming enzyme family protein [Hydrocarboniphaga sp.]MDB5969916.1 long-chain fatty acid--CoA ligase [Hydrocarboniphaga sp.]
MAMASVAQTLQAVMAIDPAAPAVEFQRQWISWGVLDAQVRAIDSLVTHSGLGPGTRVGILLRNRPPQLAAMLAAIVSSRCMVTLNPVLPDDKLLDDLSTLQLPVVIGERSEFERPGVLEALRAAGSAVIALADDITQLPAFVPGLEKPRGERLRREQPGVIVEMLSSGTTGKPKRIPMHTRAFEMGFAAGQAYEKGGADARPQLRSGTMILTLPFTHISGLWTPIQCIAGGRKCCLMERFKVDDWHDAVKRHRPRMFAGPPTMLRMLLDAKLPKEDLASLLALRTGTAPLDPAVADEFYQRYGIPVLQNYGATEFAGAVAGWSIEDFKRHRQDKRGAVGRLQAGVEARIVDLQSFEPLEPGRDGLLELRGAQLGDATAWTRTTDRAILDADGFLFITGRADNAILRGGFKIHPDEVVKVLEGHPAIKEASVVGLKDERLGEVPVAALIANAGVPQPGKEELNAYLRSRLTAYQIPVEFRFVDELPRTPSMKVSQPAVRALFRQ